MLIMENYVSRSTFEQSGAFRDNEKFVERVMDNNDLEKERGITIL